MAEGKKNGGLASGNQTNPQEKEKPAKKEDQAQVIDGTRYRPYARAETQDDRKRFIL